MRRICASSNIHCQGFQYGAAESLSVQDYRNIQRWHDMLFDRPAVKRGRKVNCLSGDPAD